MKIEVHLFIFIICYFIFLAMPQSIQDLSSVYRRETCAPAVGVQSPEHWTPREDPELMFTSFKALKSPVTLLGVICVPFSSRLPFLPMILSGTVFLFLT